MNPLLNLLVFNAAWWAAVLGAANGLPWAGPAAAAALVAVHLSLVGRRAAEFQLILVAVAIGIAADSLLILGGFMAPEGVLLDGATTPWLACMWAGFATTLNHSLGWMRGRHALAVLFGALGGPAAYYGGARLGALDIEGSVPAALAAIAAAWGVAMPLLMAATERLLPAAVEDAGQPEPSAG